MIVKKIIDTFELNFQRADEYVSQMSNFELSCELFKDIEKVKTMDGFVYRFTKIQDMMGEKLFPLYLESVNEYKSSMSLLDILNKLEKLEIINSTQKWNGFRKLRNVLTHEYPDNEDEIVAGVKSALVVYSEIKFVFEKIKKELI